MPLKPRGSRLRGMVLLCALFGTAVSVTAARCDEEMLCPLERERVDAVIVRVDTFTRSEAEGALEAYSSCLRRHTTGPHRLLAVQGLAEVTRLREDLAEILAGRRVAAAARSGDVTTPSSPSEPTSGLDQRPVRKTPASRESRAVAITRSGPPAADVLLSRRRAGGALLVGGLTLIGGGLAVNGFAYSQASREGLEPAAFQPLRHLAIGGIAAALTGAGMGVVGLPLSLSGARRRPAAEGGGGTGGRSPPSAQVQLRRRRGAGVATLLLGTGAATAGFVGNYYAYQQAVAWADRPEVFEKAAGWARLGIAVGIAGAGTALTGLIVLLIPERAGAEIAVIPGPQFTIAGRF